MQPDPSALGPRPLRLFEDPPAGVGAPGQLSPGMTLSEFYAAFFRPVCLVARGTAPRNLDQYDQSVAYWSRFTGDPPLTGIDDFTTASFCMRLRELPGRKKTDPIGPNTIRKHFTHLQAVLDRTGPRTGEARFRKAQGLLATVPYLEKPAAKKKDADDNFSLAEIGTILRHCEAAIAPAYLRGTERAAWWRNLFLCAYNTGLRIGSINIVEWTAVRTDPAGLAWIHVQVKGGNTRKIHANEFAIRAIEAMRPLTGHYAHVWHWPHVQSWLQENRRRILVAAGLPQERRFGFHGFRKAMCTQASKIDALGSSMQAGHQDMATTIRNYINPARVADSMAKLPQPDAPPENDRQRRLF